jgi:hypothetical protein
MTDYTFSSEMEGANNSATLITELEATPSEETIIYSSVVFHDCHPTRACSPTPLRGHKIVRILERKLGSNALPTYCGGAADAQSVGRI